MYLVKRSLKANFLKALERLSDGQLTLKTPEGECYRFGTSGPEAEMLIRDWATVSALAAHGQVGLGEAYVQGMWDTSSIETLIRLAIDNRERLSAYDRATPISRARLRLVDTVLRANSRSGARKNIRAHYDVGNEFYALWLDQSMTYSSALFADKDDDLAKAQQRKISRALSRLNTGERTLEVGCGWGSFAEAAADQGRDVTGITVSRNQHSYAESLLDGRANIQLRDYRDLDESYDNIVSIEMVEAVGARYWPSYFRALKHNLAEGGRILIQAITVRDGFFETYRTSSDYIRHHVFPGGMLLSDKVIADQARRAGLQIRDRFAFGQDYAKTLRIWSERLIAQKGRIDALGYGESFFRHWNYYLEICAASFASKQTNVVQVEMSHA